MRAAYAVLGLMLLAGARADVSRAAAPHPTAWKPATEFGPLVLGMPLDQALAALPEAKWNGSAAQQCIDDLARKGCFLIQYQSPFAYQLDGIAFDPQLSFNTKAVLTDLILVHDQWEIGTAADCRSIYARAIDVTARDYGPMAFGAQQTKGGWRKAVLTTAAGLRYPISADPQRGDFVAGPVRNNFGGVRFPTSASIATWNALPYVHVFAMFLTIDRKPLCRVTITFSLPHTVERRRD